MFLFAKKLVDRLDGAAASADTAVLDSYYKHALQLNNNGYGLRVVSIVPHSTAHQHGLEAWFDYIIKINGHELPMLYSALSHQAYTIQDDGSIRYGGSATAEQVGLINYPVLQQELATIAHNAAGNHEVVLEVWNAKGGVVRQVALPLTPEALADDGDDAARGASLYAHLFARLGVTLQSQHLTTATYVWRILNTHAGSPAFQAKLVPYSDYIIGCDSAYSDTASEQGLLVGGGELLLSRVVLGYYNHHHLLSGQDHIPITLYVYNHDYDILRPVTVNLSRGWSGNEHNRGVLGCDVGYGWIHRLPEVVGKFTNTLLADDVLFENPQQYAYQDTDAAPPPPPAPADNGSYFVPLAMPALPPKGPTPGAKKKKHATTTAALDGLNDYMNEELAKSKEMDAQGGARPSAALAPPPPPPPSK